MTEIRIGWLISLSGLGLVIASTLYWWGGTTNKLWRRLGGSLVLSSIIIGNSLIFGHFKPLLLGIPLCLFIAFSIGYGAETGLKKAFRRVIYVLGVCSAGLLYCLAVKGLTWMILPLHIGVGTWSVWLGVKNPLHSKAEEFIICMLLNIGLISYPFIRG